MNELFKTGDIITGYCNGFFGRDDYDAKVCVMVTQKYAVFEYTEGQWEGRATVLNYKDSLKEVVHEWKNQR